MTSDDGISGTMRMGDNRCGQGRAIAAAARVAGWRCWRLRRRRRSRSTDRFKSLFGGKFGQSRPQVAAPVRPPAAGHCRPDLSAGRRFAPAPPPMRWRRRASRRSATICAFRRRSPAPRAIAASMAARSPRGSAFRAASSPARPARRPSVEVPLRVAVVQGGVAEKTIATKAYQTTVTMTEDGSVPFSLVAEDLVYPAPPARPAILHLLYRLRSAGAEARAEAEAPKKK